MKANKVFPGVENNNVKKIKDDTGSQSGSSLSSHGHHKRSHGTHNVLFDPTSMGETADGETSGKSNIPGTIHGASIRNLLPQIMNEQNRKILGTWQRKFDFTRTIIGYLLGIHNFFRFPYLCYKYGGVFFIPYIITMVLVGVPTVFMEFTIGQYCGVGSFIAFTHMSPILTCVSKLLTWSCIVNCWMYTVILAWLRIYASDCTSCLRGWEVCDPNHYFNSPHCYTGIADDVCNDPGLVSWTKLTEGDVLGQDMLFYNFKCRSVTYYCQQQGWEEVPGNRTCRDEGGGVHSIYERRYHAIVEYFYGAVLGLERRMDAVRKAALIKNTISVANLSIAEIRMKLHKSEHGGHYNNSIYDNETVRHFMKDLGKSKNVTKLEQYNLILDNVVKKEYQDIYWQDEGQELKESLVSSSYLFLKEGSVSTWITIGVFLFEDLLRISFLSYILNAFPFAILIYITILTMTFEHAWFGIENLFNTEDFWNTLWSFELWAEAVVQVIYTSGIGNGVLISLASFNNFENSFLFDIYCTLGMSIITSFCGAFICFCSIGHYMKQHDIDVPFREYIQTESNATSMEFCFIAYSHFLSLIKDRNISTLAFFFMVSSFATDTAIRLVQNVLDAIAALIPRLKHHSFLVLVAVCLTGYFILIPVMKNGGIFLFIDYEYFVMQYMFPTVVAIEIAASAFVYGATRITDHAEQMEVFASYFFRLFITGLMYISFFIVTGTVVVNLTNHQRMRFIGRGEGDSQEIFGWVFFISPFLMAVLSVIKQLIVIPRHRWRWLLVPMQGKDRKVRRAFLRRLQGGGTRQKQENEGATDQEQIRAAAARMRVLESRFIIAMMQKRREEQQKKKKQQQSETETSEADTEAHHEAERPPSSLPPLFASLVRVAAAEFASNNRKSGRKSNFYEGENVEDQSQHDFGAGMMKSFKAFVTCERIRKCWKKGMEARRNSMAQKAKAKEKRDAAEDLEEKKEQQRMGYIDMMDNIERWPGRLDESDIESEGSSVFEDESEEEVYDAIARS